MNRQLILSATALVLLSGFAGVAQAGVIFVNTFDGGQAPPPGGSGPNAPAVPTDANGVHALGVTFLFREGGAPSSNSIYGAAIGAAGLGLSPLSDPVLYGPASGVLDLAFDSPSTFLAFDIAYMASGAPAGTVSVCDTALATDQCSGPSEAIVTTGGVGMLGLFSVGQFSWVPTSSFNHATITFDVTGANFAIDNLSYDDPPVGAAGTVPEPATLALIGCGAILAGFLGKSRR